MPGCLSVHWDGLVVYTCLLNWDLLAAQQTRHLPAIEPWYLEVEIMWKSNWGFHIKERDKRPKVNRGCGSGSDTVLNVPGRGAGWALFRNLAPNGPLEPRAMRNSPPYIYHFHSESFHQPRSGNWAN